MLAPALESLIAGKNEELLPSWHDSAGTPIQCPEKKEAIEQRVTDFCALAQEIIEDAVILGISEQQIRRTLADFIPHIQVSFK